MSGPRPPARSDHVAVDPSGNATTIAIYGGWRKPSASAKGAVRSDFWKLHKPGSDWVWQTIVATGTSPGPRYGHAAVLAPGRKMYLFGGSGVPGLDPTDNNLYRFDFGPGDSSGTWQVITVSGTPPEPRRDHTMVLHGSSLLIYGGYLNTTSSSSALFKFDIPTATWSTITTTGPSPGPRTDHSAFFEVNHVGPWLQIFGGEKPTASDPEVDKRVYMINPFPVTGTPTWVQGPEAAYRLSGHSVGADPFGDLHARIPEIYDPTSNQWTLQAGAGWLPPEVFIGDYPVQFLVPGTSSPGGGGRLLRVGRDPAMRYLDIPAAGLAGPWNEVTNGHSGTFLPLTGVQYAPGKILVVDGQPAGLQSSGARTFDATAIGTATWVDRPGLGGDLDPDLLALPNGKVMYLGTCPQIWDPSTGLWSGFSPCDLETVPISTTHGYHSTAMLLPDGKVLMGSWTINGLRVYCPPYLFDANGSPAARPTITSAPASVVYGEAFVVGKMAADQIGSACLIRPAAVTHSFDQNGRYVPLTFQTLTDSTLQTWAPTDGSVAPPGDYMLFILNTEGVPAIAKWVHLGDCAQVPCDTGSPPQVTDLQSDVVTPNEVWLVWSAPGDDNTPLTGSYDLRISTTGIANDQGYGAATPLSGEPAVQAQSTPVSHTVTGLTACTQYHFALKTRDGTGPSFKNWSLLSNTATVTTLCGPLAAAVASSDAGSGVLEAETRRTREGGWQVTLRRLAEAKGVEAADRNAIVSQVRDAAGGWRTLAKHRPAPGQYPLGLCALRDGGRVVFPAGYGVDRVVPRLRSGGKVWAISAAEHSQSGVIGSHFLAEGGAVEMRSGDVLTLTYDPASAGAGDEVSAYLQLRWSGQAAGPDSPTGRPTSFSLHQNQPNPFGRSTTIGFDLPVAGSVRLEVFDLLGRRVATLAARDYPAGSHTVEWDLRAVGGAPVRAGVYVYRLQSGTFSARRKMSVMP